MSSMSSLGSLPLLVWHHLFWVMWPCFIDWGHFGFWFLFFELHIQCPLVYTTDALHRGGDETVSSATMFRPFLTQKKHNAYGCFYFLFLSSSFTQHQTLLQASHTLKLISPLFMNAKIIYHVTWKERLLYCSFHWFLSVKKIFVCLHCYLKKCNVCFLAWPTSQTTG